MTIANKTHFYWLAGVKKGFLYFSIRRDSIFYLCDSIYAIRFIGKM